MALVSSVSNASADGPITLGLTPIGAAGSNFTLTMQPGDSQRLNLKLANFGTDPVLARTFVADAYSMINGGFAVRLEDGARTGTTTWLDYPPADLVLAPGTFVERGLTVAVPLGTAPGEYLSSVVLQNADPFASDAGGEGMLLKQIIRQVVAVSIDVPGARTPALALGEITHSIVADHSVLSVAVDNTGNVRVTPTGELVLWNSAGAEVTRFPIVMDTVYAHTDTLAQIPFTRQLNAGAYTAEVDLADASGVSATSGKVPFTVAATTPIAGAPAAASAQANQGLAALADSTNPWAIAATAFGAGLAVMLAAAGIGFLVYRRRRQSGPA